MLSRRVRWIGVAVLSVAVFIAFITLAKEIRVPQDFPTIQKAVDAAAPGDVIIIDKGIYKEFVVIPETKPRLTLRCLEGAVIEGTINSFAETTTIEGCTITGPGHGIRLFNATGSKVLKNSLIRNDRHGVVADGRYSGILIEENKINGNGETGVCLLARGEDIIVRGNEIKDNVRVGVGIVPTVVRVLLEKNVISGNKLANIHDSC